jgi:RimJ/RimL family protein N-acetyltransferase
MFALSIEGSELKIKITADDDIGRLLSLVNRGLHDPDQSPFSTPWNQIDLPHRNYEFAKKIWLHRAQLHPRDWYLDFTVFYKDQIVGMQSVFAKDFPVARSFMTSSWLGRDFQNRGIGTTTRRAILFLMFELFKAEEGHSEAYEDNIASIKVCEKLGYRANGFRSWGRNEKPAKSLQFVITRQDYARNSISGFISSGTESAMKFLELYS